MSIWFLTDLFKPLQLFRVDKMSTKDQIFMKNKLYFLIAGCIALQFSASANNNLPETSRESAPVQTIEKQRISENPVVTENDLNEAIKSMDLPEKKEKKLRKRISKLERKLENRSESLVETNTILLVILAILLPPVAVLLVDGFGGPFLLSILLTLLGFLPGIIYALWRISRSNNA